MNRIEGLLQKADQSPVLNEIASMLDPWLQIDSRERKALLYIMPHYPVDVINTDLLSKEEADTVEQVVRKWDEQTAVTRYVILFILQRMINRAIDNRIDFNTAGIKVPEYQQRESRPFVGGDE